MILTGVGKQMLVSEPIPMTHFFIISYSENFATEQTPAESNTFKIKRTLLNCCSLRFSGNNCLSILSGSKLATIRLEKVLWNICRFILFMFVFRVSSIQMVYTDGTVHFLRNSQHKRRMLNKSQN